MSNIAKGSAQSLLLEMKFGEVSLSKGTGFIVCAASGMFLITNRHNVTGRHQSTGKPLSAHGGLPDRLCIHHHKNNSLGDTVTVEQCLYDESGMSLWMEHPVHGRNADFIALPLDITSDIAVFPHIIRPEFGNIKLHITQKISVVGFPFGLTSGGAFAIWATGFIASEPELNYENLPVFLIDCRSRQGQSGSAVVAYVIDGLTSLTDGSSSLEFSGKPKLFFLGVYSGRINSESDLGRVWKASALNEMVRFGSRANYARDF